MVKWPVNRGKAALAAGLLLLPPTGTPAAPPAGSSGPGGAPLPPAEAAALLARRRAGPAVLVRRGMTALAPENTLRAFGLAMDYGADGVAVEVRRTRDGVLVVFADETVERLLRGVGRVREHTLAQLRALRPVTRYGRLLGGNVATLAELGGLARARAMLLRLDLKEPGLEADVARLLTGRGLWPQVVAFGPGHADSLRRDPRFHPLRPKAPSLAADRRDLDPGAVAAALARPGELLLVGDPRVAARALRRPPPRPRWVITKWRFVMPPAAATTRTEPVWRPPEVIERLNRLRPPPTEERLLSLLRDAERPLPGLSERQRVVLLSTRAWLVMELGARGRNNRTTRRALEGVIAHPLTVADPALDGVDVALAIRALGELGSTASAKLLTRFFPAGAKAAATNATARARRWRRRRYLIPALGGLRCRAARRFLADYVRQPAAAAARYGPPQFAAATRALMQQRLDWAAIARLLRSPNSVVRGTALLECLDHANEERRLALRQAAPWAFALPGPRAVLPSPAAR